MDKTEAILRKLFAALPSPSYDLGILADQGMYRLEAVHALRILRMLPYLKYRNANGAHIYLRPTGESAYTLLDDLAPTTLARLDAEGYDPAAVVETSPGSFQAWLRHEQPLSKELGTLAAKTLAARFAADRSAADWRRFGRAPGFTNRKPQHRNTQGLYPFARLTSHAGQPFPAGESFGIQLVMRQKRAEQERAAARLNFASRPLGSASPVTLSRFRTSARYIGRPAAADMAFASPPTLRVGPNPTSQQHLPMTTFPATRTAPARPPTFTERSAKPSDGQHNSTIQGLALFARQGEPLAVSPCTLFRLDPAPVIQEKLVL